ncbi:MarR family transcriptional regulator [Carbonactinospora thermoautotrophica]|uniref:Regulatory protein n=1 Tax=Carbonactinospora thermoautotrophica TaxID=1469144 RepID=A0A132MWK8_9ACTN|nr:MarR family transcriptional regulator [Carbonactinospora thermoautotrophica]KWX02241.1 Regulatory protein [Carbonactinospora thermoautotrophica]MCX9190133.1 MarR family transcriptional regulator [Carbonactinospora thermoautotrophica]
MRRSLLDSPSYRLIRALGQHKAALYEVLRRHGLHVGQEFLLAQLWREDGLTMGELAARAGVSSAAVTKVAGSLERAGLVRRERSAEDARVVRVWLTEAGRALEGPVTAAWYETEHLLRERADTIREALTALAELEK